MRRGEKGTTERGKRSLSEFIKYQGNIAGTGSVSRTGALVPLITTDKKPGAEEAGKWGGGEGQWGRVEEVKTLPETLVLIMEGGPNGAEGVFRGTEGKNTAQTNWVRRYAAERGAKGDVALQAHSRAGDGKSCASFHTSILERMSRNM